MATLRTCPDTPPMRAPVAAPQNDDVAIDEEWNGQAPDRYAVREIEFKMVDGELQFAYRNDCRARQLPANGLLNLSQAYCGASGAGDAAEAFPVHASAVPQTPLDLEVAGGGAPLYIFLKLAEPGNMTFSATLEAITHKNGADAIHYGGLRHVDADGEAHPEPVPGCRLVYFVAAPAAGDYRHGFNFNVDLEQKPGISGARRMLPLTIDPDIRFPGGSGV